MDFDVWLDDCATRALGDACEDAPGGGFLLIPDPEPLDPAGDFSRAVVQWENPDIELNQGEEIVVQGQPVRVVSEAYAPFGCDLRNVEVELIHG